MKIYFEAEINGLRTPLFIMKVNKEGMKCVLELWEDAPNEAEMKYLGDIQINCLLQILNREKLSCKYGHPIEIGKRKKQRRIA